SEGLPILQTLRHAWRCGSRRRSLEPPNRADHELPWQLARRRIKKLFVTVSIAAALCGMLWLTLPAAAAPPRLLAHVQLAAMPPAASPAASSVRQTPAQAQTKQTSAKPAQLTMIDPVRPLGKMQPAPQQ